MINLRKFLFSYRSFTPLPLVIALLYFASPALPFVYFGVAMALIGESIRITQFGIRVALQEQQKWGRRHFVPPDPTQEPVIHFILVI